jgi:hypothetical protein
MLVSASGAKRSKSDWQISFGFAWGEQVSETMSLGGSSVNVTRRYHDILWTLESTKSEVIGGSAFIFPQPKAAYVHRPHGETNFLTALGF